MATTSLFLRSLRRSPREAKSLLYTLLTGVFLMISDYDVNINNMYMVVVVTIQ